MATIPTLQETLNTDFTHTWYKIRPEAIDNINEATVFSLALQEFGCMTPQTGGRYITRTVRYGEKSTQNVAEGSVLDQDVKELETMARWNWKYILVDVNQSVIDAQKNSGEFKIKDYIATRLTAARDAIVRDNNQHYMRSGFEDSTGKQCNGLYDIVAPVSATANNLYDAHSVSGIDTYNDSTASESNGNIPRSNSWWQNTYYDADSQETNYELTLVPAMRTLWNKCTDNQESPNFILMNRNLFEAYEDEIADKQQIVRTAFDQKAADLGFETFTFKGASVAWESDLDEGSNPYYDLFMLNMNYIELVYDPNLWFEMTPWKSTPNQLEQVAYIISARQLITDQPRRHGWMTFTS